MSVLFQYSALTQSRQRVDGQQSAANEQEVLKVLAAHGLTVLSIVPTRSNWSIKETLTKEISISPLISRKELAAIIFELGGLLSAGVTLDESLGVISEGRSTARAIGFVQKIHVAVKSGSSLHQILAAHSREVPAEIVGVVRAGEVSGTLGTTLSKLAQDLNEQQKHAADFHKALIYPIILAITALTVVVVLFVVVIPELEGLFPINAREKLPIIAQIVFDVSELMRRYGLLFLAGFGTMTLSLLLVARRERFARKLDLLWLSVPLLGPVLKSQGLARFLRVLASLLQGGVTIEKSLEIAARTQANRVLYDRCLVMHRQVVEGRAFSDVARTSGFFGKDMLSIIRAGEKSGQLRQMLERASVLSQERAQARLQTFVTIVGPLLTALLGAIAGMVAYAVLGTLLSINELALQ